MYSGLNITETNSLKNGPKDFEKDHPAITFLKLKSFIAVYPLADSELLKPTIVDKLITAFATIQPFVLFLRKATEVA